MVFLPNSPRWLAEKGRHIEAEEVLRMLRDTSEKAREEQSNYFDAQGKVYSLIPVSNTHMVAMKKEEA